LCSIHFPNAYQDWHSGEADKMLVDSTFLTSISMNHTKKDGEEYWLNIDRLFPHSTLLFATKKNSKRKFMSHYCSDLDSNLHILDSFIKAPETVNLVVPCLISFI
jgi:hypothetical protein